MRRAFSDLIIQSFTDEEIDVLDLMVEHAMLPEDEDGRWVMDEDPNTLSDWRYKTPAAPLKPPLVRNPFPRKALPAPDPEDTDGAD